MSDYRIEGSPDFPQGRQVPLTDAEKARCALDQIEAQAAQAATDKADTAARGLRGQLAALLDDAETAERGWATLTAAQKLDGALRTSLRMDVALARLLLRRLDNP